MSKYTLSTQKLSFTVDTSPLKIISITNRLNAKVCSTIDSEIFWIECNDQKISASQFNIMFIEKHDDGVSRLLKFSMCHKCGVCAYVSFLANLDDTIEVIIQMQNGDGKEARFVGIGFPFMSDGKMLGLKNSMYYSPSKPFESSRGEALLDLHAACPKVMSFVRNDGYGFDLTFDIPRGSNTQECTLELQHISSLDELKEYKSLVRLNRYRAVTMQVKFDAVSKGWMETFGKIKSTARSKVDMYNYMRPDLKWYNNIFLHQFAYIYSREVYDYENDRVDIERLINAGKDFGGYDAICLWHQYPRLGVDERSQWDFFEDFPGGLNGIAEITKKCHEKGIKVMLPYKPWDAPDNMSTDDTARKLAHVIEKTDVDGFFLDTMFNILDKFRTESDRVKKGCAFCTELQPENGRTIEVLTGSWQQSAALPYQTPILRYVFPEHRSHFISRWSIDSDRDNMLKKAIMNGSGLVIWQDIFGSWLPYEDYQKAEVKKWKNIWLDNRNCFLSKNVFPLWPALQCDLVINAFIDDLSGEAIFTVYNNSGSQIEGELFSCQHYGKNSAYDLWNDDTDIYITDKKVFGSLKSQQTAIIKVK